MAQGLSQQPGVRSRGQRIGAALRLGVTGLAAGLAILLPANLLWRFRVNIRPSVSLRAYDGLLALAVDDGSHPLPMGLYWQGEPRPHVKFELKHFGLAGGGRVFAAPIVIPLALSGGASGLLWWRELRRRRRALQGHCRKCGYDLRGLAGGNCPECGAVAPAPAAATPAVA